MNRMDVQEWNPKDKYIDANYDEKTGTRKKKMEKQLEELEEKYPTKTRAVDKSNVLLASVMIADADYIVIQANLNHVA
ncbi:uncharacterized protein A4U43_C03F22970 [Asparagus officinalis]|uniref:Uncharacterized protein n=1 Tax=Asparagus officinalis TaxID=4686 RepID=A0A5P1FF48_ASPOF|nr:uncharacterized protein A4U43_C03F22970 [Asparagus officinalis]